MALPADLESARTTREHLARGNFAVSVRVQRREEADALLLGLALLLLRGLGVVLRSRLARSIAASWRARSSSAFVANLGLAMASTLACSSSSFVLYFITGIFAGVVCCRLCLRRSGCSRVGAAAPLRRGGAVIRAPRSGSVCGRFGALGAASPGAIAKLLCSLRESKLRCPASVLTDR